MGTRQRLSGPLYTKRSWTATLNSRTNADYPHDDFAHTENIDFLIDRAKLEGGPLRITLQRLHRTISRWSSEAAQLFGI
jgi:hypothetical protein